MGLGIPVEPRPTLRAALSPKSERRVDYTMFFGSWDSTWGFIHFSPLAKVTLGPGHNFWATNRDEGSEARKHHALCDNKDKLQLLSHHPILCLRHVDSSS